MLSECGQGWPPYQGHRMSFRTVAVLLAGTLLVSGTAAAAAPASVSSGCPLLVDARDDATGAGSVGVSLPNDPHLDVVSADLDTHGGTVTGVIRLTELGAVDPLAPTGRTYYLNFSAPGAELYLSAAVHPIGEVLYRAGVRDSARRTLSTVSGTLDTARAELRITAPVTAFGPYAKRLSPGRVLQRIDVLTQRLVATPQTGGVTLTADAATTGRTHVVGSRGCSG